MVWILLIVELTKLLQNKQMSDLQNSTFIIKTTTLRNFKKAP